MTINGPAPTILAFFMNAAIDQQVERHLRETGEWERVEQEIAQRDRPTYKGELPEGHSGLGLGLLGVSGEEVVDRETYERIREHTLQQVRGTVQADILKEDQAQNTCIFSTEFALHMMGDIQQYFIDHSVRNFYSVSISGYHIAEAGANPITQLAFTLANGFTIVEYYLSRGMRIDDFAPSLSFFFSNGMDPEYAVIGRVARRIWARAMKTATPPANAPRNSSTTSRPAGAASTPRRSSSTTSAPPCRRSTPCSTTATACTPTPSTKPSPPHGRLRAPRRRHPAHHQPRTRPQRLRKPWQGSHIIEQLTDKVEEAVLQEFERLNERGGVLGAMDTMYQRGKIQDESMVYEHRKNTTAACPSSA